MLDGISPALAQASPYGLLILTFFSLFGAIWKGLLFTKPGVDKLIEVQEARIREAIEREKVWKDAAERWQQTAQSAITDRTESLEQGRTMIRLLTARQPGRR